MPLQDSTPDIYYFAPNRQVRRVFYFSHPESSTSSFRREHAVDSEFVQFLGLLLNLFGDRECYLGIHRAQLLVEFGFLEQAAEGFNVFGY